MAWISNDDSSLVILKSISENNTQSRKNVITIIEVDKPEACAIKQFSYQNKNTLKVSPCIVLLIATLIVGGVACHESLVDARNDVILPKNKLEDVVEARTRLKIAEHQSKYICLNATEKTYNYTVDNHQQVQKFMSDINVRNLLQNVHFFQELPTRWSFSRYSTRASNKVKKLWSDLIPLNRSDIEVKFYHHPNQVTHQPSVVLNISGNEEESEIVILGAHLDSTNHFGNIAPGADDNASGLSLLTECLRVIAENNYKPRRTVQLIGFAAEEEGLKGSQDMAYNYLESSKNVVGMLNFDMTGYKGSEKDVYLVEDYTNSGQNSFLTDLMEINEITHGYTKCNYKCSDHYSWWSYGFSASMATESKFEDINPDMHTSRDTKVDQHHIKNFAKLALAYIAELAKTSTY